uniref:Reverse transcriptase zinc-binding domain-containing protein n=1 Tax=Chenopodium quinoa TaxID=63459 RepID=A0A803N7Q2_CHEQI
MAALKNLSTQDVAFVKLGNIVCLKVAQRAPNISHLFFADDSMFFLHGKENYVRALKNALDIYCKASGQVISQSKLMLLASPNSKEEDINNFSNILGISRSNNFGIYLGTPADFGTTKKEIFGFMVDRVKERLNAWNSLFLSPAGRLTLIKSVLSSLGTYVLSILKCPMGILKKINSIIAKFWWMGNKDCKGVYWKSWNHLTTPKKNGGLGILDAWFFNQDLLEKQGWRIIMDTDSLVPGWNGHTGSTNATIFSLLNCNGEWNLDECNLLFNEDTVEKTTSIHLIETGHEDLIVWNGDRQIATSTGSFFWSFPGNPRQKTFMWEILKGVLPTRSERKRRGLGSDHHCVLCFNEEEREKSSLETLEHLFRDYTFASHIWKGCSLGLNVNYQDNIPIADWVYN